MKHLLVILLILFSATLGWRVTDPIPGVLDLSPQNFTNYVDGTKNYFIMFYAHWSGHCKAAMAMGLRRLGPLINKQPLEDLVLARMNVVAEENEVATEFAERWGINGYPTIRWFEKGKLPSPSYSGEEYQGPRRIQSMLDFLNNKLGTSLCQDESMMVPVLSTHDAAAAEMQSLADSKPVLKYSGFEWDSFWETFEKVYFEYKGD